MSTKDADDTRRALRRTIQRKQGLPRRRARGGGPEKTMKFCLVKVYGQNQLQTVATTSKVYSCNVKQLSNDMYALLISVTLKAIKPNGYTAVW